MSGKVHRTDRVVRNRVSDRVREMISMRGLGPGDRLPTYHELIRDLGASLVTVKRGLDDLEAEGLIRRFPARGTFVAKSIPRMPRELKHIGIIYPSSRAQLFSAQYTGEIMRGIAQEASPSTDTHIFSLREDGLVRAPQLGEWDIDGAVLLGVESDDYLRNFAQWGTPGVVVDYCSQAAPFDYVACDNAAAARDIAARLAAYGHRRVAYVARLGQDPVINPGNPQVALLVRESSDVRERHADSVAALRERHIQVDDWAFSGIVSEGIAAAADQLQVLRRSPGHPTAVLTDSNHCAFEIMKELGNRGLRVPEDVSVGAVAADGDMTMGGKTLTCCRFDFTGMGRKAIELLSERRRTRPLTDPCVHRIGFEFVEGQTVRRV